MPDRCPSRATFPTAIRSGIGDAVFYELRVGAFSDSDGDGVGDFRGLTERLDYLRDLGVTTLWLLPFYPSPGRDDGYDIADYTDIHPQLGTLDDFREFLREAHKRELRVVTELVINHTSDQHPWFQRARRSPPGSKYRDYYVWSDTPERWPEARIIFKDFEPSNWSWDPVAKAYYWHRFFSHQPDLNFDNPAVRRKPIMEAMDVLARHGPGRIPPRRGARTCSSAPAPTARICPRRTRSSRSCRQFVDSRLPRTACCCAEANQWPADVVEYFGPVARRGDRPLDRDRVPHGVPLPRHAAASSWRVRTCEDALPDRRRSSSRRRTIPQTAASGRIFLRNHDELTLEMVTDEDRDYMYQRLRPGPAHARINLGIRRRLAPLFGNDRNGASS